MAPSVFAGGVACILLLALAWRQGGYFPDTFAYAGAVAFGGLALVLVVRPPYYRLSTSALVAVAALAALAVWTALSSRWSSAQDVALEDFERDLLYVALLGLGVLAAGSGRYSRHVVWVTFGLVLTIVGAGMVSRLQPDWIDPGPAASGLGEWRLSYPLGYWNAFGALGALGVILGAGLAADPRSHVLLRAVAAGGVVVLGTAAYLSFSRGAWLAFFAGLVVLLLMSSHRPSLLVTLAICGTALAITIGRLGAYPALTDGPRAGAGVLTEGDRYLPFLVFFAVAAALAQIVASGRWLPSDVRALLVRRARPLGWAFAALAVLAALGFYLFNSAAIEGGSANRLQQASDWVDRQWDEFMTPAGPGVTRTASARLTSAGGTRSDLYRVAIDGFEAHPLWGDGSGGFEHRFAHDRKVSEKVRDAHSLYLETAGELGLPGIALLLTLVGAIAWAAIVARRRGGSLSGAQTAAATGALTVWLVHAGVDWDWQMPAFTGIALLLAAALFPEGRGRRARPRAERRNAVRSATLGLQQGGSRADAAGGRSA